MSESVTLTKSGAKSLTFHKGALHRALGVEEGTKIPEAKKRSALSGEEGPAVKKMAVLAFRGALATGRKTAARHRKVSR